MIAMNKTPISMTPTTFICIFKVLEPDMCLKFSKENSFVESQEGNKNIMQEFISSTSQVPSDLSVLDISLFIQPFRDF